MKRAFITFQISNTISVLSPWQLPQWSFHLLDAKGCLLSPYIFIQFGKYTAKLVAAYFCNPSTNDHLWEKNKKGDIFDNKYMWLSRFQFFVHFLFVYIPPNEKKRKKLVLSIQHFISCFRCHLHGKIHSKYCFLCTHSQLSANWKHTYILFVSKQKRRHSVTSYVH